MGGGFIKRPLVLRTLSVYKLFLYTGDCAFFRISLYIGDFEFLRTFIIATALDTLNFEELSSCTGYFEFLRIPHLLETLNFYDFLPCIGLRFFNEFPLVLGTLSFYKLFPMLLTLNF